MLNQNSKILYFHQLYSNVERMIMMNSLLEMERSLIGGPSVMK